MPKVLIKVHKAVFLKTPTGSQKGYGRGYPIQSLSPHVGSRSLLHTHPINSTCSSGRCHPDRHPVPQLSALSSLPQCSVRRRPLWAGPGPQH